jgi:hypothetical protein
MLPSCPSPPKRVDFRVFARLGTPESLDANPGYPLMGFCPPSEFAQTLSRCHNQLALEALTATSHEVSSPSASPHTGLQPRCRGSTAPQTLNAFRFSQPLDALTEPMLAGFLSNQFRSWGSPFRALLLSHSRPLSPAPLPSCRWMLSPAHTNHIARCT